MVEYISIWHPIFIHFPIVLVVIATTTFLAAIIFRKHRLSESLFLASKYTIWFAGIQAMFTVYTGWLAYNTPLSNQATTLVQSWAIPASGAVIIIAALSFFLHKFWGKKMIFVTAIVLILLSAIVLITEVRYQQINYSLANGLNIS